jgi:hypothetical protein
LKLDTVVGNLVGPWILSTHHRTDRTWLH